MRRATPIEIVCGDCSERTDSDGNTELLPFRTLLTMDGRCFTCGGRSYVIASELCGILRRTINERRKYAIQEGFAIENAVPQGESWAEGRSAPESARELTLCVN